MLTHRWSRFLHSAAGSELASLWRQQQTLLAADQEIRGKVRSFNCLAKYVSHYSFARASTRTVHLRKHWRLQPRDLPLSPLVQRTDSFLRERLAEQLPAVFGSGAPPYVLNAMKLLWSMPGEGLQPLHYDIAHRAFAYSRYSALLYCTPCHHTAMPNAPAHTLTPAFNATPTLSKKQRERNLAVFRPVQFVSELVPAGSGLVFNAGVAHHGVANAMKTQARVVVFALFCPKLDKIGDDVQRFPLDNPDSLA